MMDNFLKDNGIKSKISEDIVNNPYAYNRMIAGITKAGMDFAKEDMA